MQLKGMIVTLVIGLFLAVQVNAKSAPSAEEIFEKVESSSETSNEVAQLQMKIKARDGSVKERTLEIKKQSGNSKKALVKLQSPEDLKGIGFLSVGEEGQAEAQWLFLPSEKRSRRISGSSKNGNFLDSDLSYEDLSTSTYKNFNNRVVKVINKKGKKVAIIESKVKKKGTSSYSKITTWIDIDKYQLLKANYYNKRGKLTKKMLFKNYKKYGNIWRAQKVVVQNIRKKSATSLTINELSFDELNEGDFSISSLEEL